MDSIANLEKIDFILQLLLFLGVVFRKKTNKSEKKIGKESLNGCWKEKAIPN